MYMVACATREPGKLLPRMGVSGRQPEDPVKETAFRERLSGTLVERAAQATHGGFVTVRSGQCPRRVRTCGAGHGPSKGQIRKRGMDL